MGGSKRGRGHAATSSTGSRLLRCAGCGVEMEPSELHIRHVVARSEGGTGEPSNLQLLCPNCSLLKTAQALSSVSNFGAFVAEAWAKAFRLAPKITTGLSALAAVAGALLAVVLGDWNNKNLASPPAATFSQQLKVLDQTQAESSKSVAIRCSSALRVGGWPTDSRTASAAAEVTGAARHCRSARRKCVAQSAGRTSAEGGRA